MPQKSCKEKPVILAVKVITSQEKIHAMLGFMYSVRIKCYLKDILTRLKRRYRR